MESNQPDERNLDRLLSQARWPEPEAERMARLGEHWRQLQIGRRRQQLAYGVLATAASIVLVAGVAAWRGLSTAPEMTMSQAKQPAPERRHPPVAQPSLAPAEIPQPGPAADQIVVSRDPNLYEQVILMRGGASRAPRRAATNRAVRPGLLDELINALAEDAEADIDQRLAAVQGDLPSCERLLGDIARQGDGGRRLGAARLLSRIGTARSLSLLTQLAGDPATHEAAIGGLARLAGERELARLASVEADERLRRDLLKALLERRTPDAVAFYLDFVSEPRLRAYALGALTETENPPAELLLAYLESPQNSRRLAAALALSRLSDPVVVERVCASVSGIGRQEALIALLLSRSEQAAGCLNQARRNLYLVASVLAAERQLHLFQFPRGGNLP